MAAAAGAAGAAAGTPGAHAVALAGGGRALPLLATAAGAAAHSGTAYACSAGGGAACAQLCAGAAGDCVSGDFVGGGGLPPLRRGVGLRAGGMAGGAAAPGLAGRFEESGRKINTRTSIS